MSTAYKKCALLSVTPRWKWWWTQRKPEYCAGRDTVEGQSRQAGCRSFTRAS